MSASSHPATYSPSQKFLHWSIFLLIAGLYAITYGEAFFPRGDPGRDAIWWLHISFGLLLVGLIVWRLAARVLQGAPAMPAGSSRAEHLLAAAGHGLLYLLLIAIPVLGISLTWLRGDELSFFGLFTIPSPVAADRETARSVKELHETAATAILVLAGLHAIAALWHHHIRKDNVLTRMLPARSGRR